MLRGLICAAVVLLAGASGPHVLHGQVMSGRVVDAVSKRPLATVPVRLLRATPMDTAARRDTVAIATAVTGADGVFVLAAPEPGTYRARIGDAYVTPPVTLAGIESFDAREYQLDAPPVPGTMRPAAASAAPPCTDAAVLAAMADGAAGRVPEDLVTGVRRLLVPDHGRATPCGFHLEQTAAVVPGTLRAAYPREVLTGGGGDARVVVEVVVDTTGRADLRTLRVLASRDAAFIPAVRAALAAARFYPAEVDHRKVRQRVELPFTFTVTP